MNARSTASTAYDAVVIGGGVGGLVAASYLARGLRRVLLLEARDQLGGRAETVTFANGFRAPLLSHTVYALDETMVRELPLFWYGLRFAKRDMNLIALQPGGQHIVLPRKASRFRMASAVQDPEDARGLLAFQKETLGLARLMRPFWDGSTTASARDNADNLLAAAAGRLRLSGTDTERLNELSRLSAAAYLDRFLVSDALKVALCFDVSAGGLSPYEAGSALMLIWRYAQESGGRRAAVSQLRGGPAALIAALDMVATRRGVDMRLGARATSIIVESGRAVGVVLASGEIVAANAVVSSLDERETLLGLIPAGAIGFGTAAGLPGYYNVAAAQLLLGLSGLPPFAGLERNDFGSRLLIADRPELAAEAKGTAVAGRLPESLPMEVTVPSVKEPRLAPEGRHVMSVVLPYMPAVIAGGWEAHSDALKRLALATLEKVAPGLRDRVVAHRLFTPDEIAGRSGHPPGELAAPWFRLLADAQSRVRTPIGGLYLCGRSAEMTNTLSGLAGRLAAALVLAEPPRRRDAGA